MHERPLISVLVPMYNAKDTIDRCLRSVLAQSYEQLEVIVVDDGSTDGSADLCKRAVDKDDRVKLVRQENQGSAAARNTALAHAGGEYIAWVDADDFVYPTFLETLYELCKNHGTDIAMCRFEAVAGGDVPKVAKDGVEPDCVMEFTEYCGNIYTVREVEMVVLWNKLYKKELWEGMAFPQDKYIDDEYVVWKLVYKAGKIAVSTRPLYYYYLSTQSVMRGEGALLRRMDGVECLEERQTFLEEKGYRHLAALTEFSLLLVAMEIMASLGSGERERAACWELQKVYKQHLKAFGKRQEVSRSLIRRLKMYALYPPLFRRTSRNEMLFSGKWL